MFRHVILGSVCLVIAAGMIMVGRPDKYGVSPKFMMHPLAFALYPAIALTFIAVGAAQLIVAFVARGQ